MEMKFCQSCGMPLTSNEVCGTNADGSLSADYCTCLLYTSPSPRD